MSSRTNTPAMPTSQATQAQMSAGQRSTSAIPHEKIAMRAYQKWCQGGCHHGTDQQNWLEAEAELHAEMMGGKAMPAMSTTAAQAGTAARAMPAAPQKSAPRR